MVQMRDRYVIHRFPLVVDPAAVSLEVQLAVGGRGPAWRQLQRVQVRHDTFPFGHDPRMVHFFGPEAVAADCPFLLAYDAAGTLRFRIDRQDGEFVAAPLPEEVNGRAVVGPSVRVTFGDPADAAAFLALVEAFRDGRDDPGADPLGRVAARATGASFTHAARPA